MTPDEPDSAATEDGHTYFVTVQGEPAGMVRSSYPEDEIKAWVAAGYRHDSITADDVVLERLHESPHTGRWEQLEVE